MDLTVYERIILLDLLPRVHGQKTHSFVRLKVLNDLVGNLGFTEQEIVDWGLTQGEDRVTWDEEAVEAKAYDLGPVATDLVLEVLRWLDEREKLDVHTFGLCLKFGYEGLEAEDEEGEEA